MKHKSGRIVRIRPVFGECHVEHALRVGIHFAREIEAREIETRRQALGLVGIGGRSDQLVLPLAQRRLAIEAPKLGIENHRPIGGSAARRGNPARQGQTARPADHDMLGRQFDLKVVGQRLNRNAVRGGKRTKFDEIQRHG